MGKLLNLFRKTEFLVNLQQALESLRIRTDANSDLLSEFTKTNLILTEKISHIMADNKELKSRICILEERIYSLRIHSETPGTALINREADLSELTDSKNQSLNVMGVDAKKCLLSAYMVNTLPSKVFIK